MQSLNKIHINGSTKISLSDRFSILQSTAPPPFKATPAKINGRRNSRSRSRSRSIHPSATVQSAPNRAVNPKASIRNRNLLAQLDQKQKMRAALKIKRKSLRTNLPHTLGQRANAPLRGRPAANLRRYNLPNARGGPAATRLNRAQNIPTIDRQKSATARRRRSVSVNRGGLAGRLGANPIVAQQQGAPRRRLNRGNLGNQQRSNSRSRSLVRSNSQARPGNAPRSQSRGRDTSVQRRGREPSVQRRGRSASRGRRPVVVAQTTNIQTPRRALSRGRSASRGRQPLVGNKQRNGRVAASTPISARLGLNRNKVAGGQRGGVVGGGVARGRVQKRVPVVRGRQQNTAQNRVDRSATRPGQRQPATVRGRSQSRGRKALVNKRINNPQGKPNNANISKANRSGGQRVAANKGAVRGRSRVRSRGGPQSGGVKPDGQPTKTREQLDKELDMYMVNTKPYGDLDVLMM